MPISSIISNLQVSVFWIWSLSKFNSLMTLSWESNNWIHKIKPLCFLLSLSSNLHYSKSWKITSTFHNNTSWKLKIDLITSPAKCLNKKDSWKVFIKSSYWGILEAIDMKTKNKSKNKGPKCPISQLSWHHYLKKANKTNQILFLKVNQQQQTFTWIKPQNSTLFSQQWRKCRHSNSWLIIRKTSMSMKDKFNNPKTHNSKPEFRAKEHYLKKKYLKQVKNSKQSTHAT